MLLIWSGTLDVPQKLTEVFVCHPQFGHRIFNGFTGPVGKKGSHNAHVADWII
jgi:hypothetical protein